MRLTLLLVFLCATAVFAVSRDEKQQQMSATGAAATDSTSDSDLKPHDSITNLIRSYMDSVQNGDGAIFGSAKATVLNNDNKLVHKVGAQGESFAARLQKTKEEGKKALREDRQKVSQEQNQKTVEEEAKQELQKQKEALRQQQIQREQEEDKKQGDEQNAKAQEAQNKRVFEEKTKAEVKKVHVQADQADEKAMREMEKQRAAEATQKAGLEQEKKKTYVEKKKRAQEVKEKTLAEARAKSGSEQERKDRELKSEELEKQTQLKEAAQEEKNKDELANQSLTQLRQRAEKEAQEKAQREALKKYTHLKSYTPQQGRVLHEANEIGSANEYSFTFWIATGQSQVWGWKNVFHHGENDGIRTPAVWLYPDRPRLHIRASTTQNWNEGADPDPDLVPGQWTHVAFTVRQGSMIVYLNGEVRATSSPGPITMPAGRLWGSNPWYPPANCQIKDFRYYQRVISSSDVQLIVRRQKHLQQ